MTAPVASRREERAPELQGLVLVRVFSSSEPARTGRSTSTTGVPGNVRVELDRLG
jgi:hypothetical protein